MNSIAKNIKTGEIIDPFGGQEDIKNKVLRHTSEAFAEDPVRALRLARFAAKYNFSYTPNTRQLVHRMVDKGELDYLTSERVFKELEKAFKDNNVEDYLENLFDLHILTRLFPEIGDLRFVWAGPEKYHGEGTAFRHTLMVVKEAQKYNNSLVTFGAILHDCGKILSRYKDSYIEKRSHPGHEEAGVPIVESFCDRLRMPNDYRRVGRLCARHHMHVHKTFDMNAKSFVRIYNDFNKGYFIHDVDVLVKVAESDHWGRISIDNDPKDGYPEAEVFRKVLTSIHDVKLRNFFSLEEIKTMTNDRIKEEFHKLKINAAKRTLKREKESLTK